MVLKRIRVPIRRLNARNSSLVRRKLPVSSQKRKPIHHPRKPPPTKLAIKRKTPSPQVLVPFPLEAVLILPARRRPGPRNPRRLRASPPLALTMPWTC